MLSRAINRAYKVGHARGWDKVYVALDLHGTALKSNYATKTYEWINEASKDALLELTKFPEIEIILWSSVHPEEQGLIVNFFESQGIRILAFNKNPKEESTTTGCFDDKFYFSVIIDDKAGFDPQDWPETLEAFATSRKIFPPHTQNCHKDGAKSPA